MKKFYQIVACASLSLLTVGAMAQIPAFAKPKQVPTSSRRLFVNPGQQSNANQTNRVQSGNVVNGLLDYVDGDATNNFYTFWNGSSGDYTAWSPQMYFNNSLSAKDTGVSPFTGGPKSNVYTANAVTVVYDTMWDNYQGAFRRVGPGTLIIDTLTCITGFHNTSGLNDTLVFWICNTTNKGMPSTSVVYDSLVEIIPPHTHGVLPGTSMDTNYVVQFTPVTPIAIPLTAQAGWHFSVRAFMRGSKKDTLGFEYYSAFIQCGGAAYSDSCTTMGVKNGSSPATNSFVTGLYWYNQAHAFGGNGAQETFPIATPAANAGLWVNNGGQQFYNFNPGCGAFFFWPGVQNIGILVSTSYEDVTGVNEVSKNNGLSVGQNYPNPFNQNTEITYNLNKSSDVVFTVYDMTGRELVNSNYSTVTPGQHVISLQANQFTPGIYFYTFNVNGSVVTKKMVITQ
jgi:hypothetical protein